MDESTVWAMCFANIMAMALHPGASRDGARPITMSEAALLADRMLIFYQSRFPKCP